MTSAEFLRVIMPTAPALILALTALLAELRHWRRKPPRTPRAIRTERLGIRANQDATRLPACLALGRDSSKTCTLRNDRDSLWWRKIMPLHNRSLPRQIVYLLLSGAVLIAVLAVLGSWHF